MIKLVTEYLDQSVLRNPDKIAVVDGNKKVTFRQLSEKAKSIATFMIKKQVFKKPIAIFLDKSVECIISFMGVAYSGNFYTPLDNKMPIDRIRKIIDTLKPQFIITDKEHFEIVSNFYDEQNILIYDDLINVKINDLLIGDILSKIIDTDVLYVLFTSGSTGMPKGVVISHKSVIDYTEWVAECFHVDEKHIFGNQAPFYFDNSILDIYQVLKTGATMVIIPEKLFSFPVLLLRFIEEHSINIIFWVPSALCLVANLKALGRVKVNCLKKVLFCGEVMPVKQLNQWIREFPEALFANLYGPTEITDVCAFYIVDRSFSDDDNLPIGKACRNSDIIVLNENNKLVQLNEIGELCVRGTSLSLGYYNDLKKTNEVFVQNPLNDAYPEKIYRTGDLVKYNEFNELMYVGRKDFQIKRMGHRIELGEIETLVSALSGVKQSCCIYDEYNNKIILFYTGNIEPEKINIYLKNKIPEYMLPNKRVKLDNMPTNINGKIDRLKLKEMELNGEKSRN